jgi:predicted esterase
MRGALFSLAVVACTSPTTEDPGPPVDPDPKAGPTLPSPTGTCPAIVNGDVTFAPAGMPPRKVKLAFDETATTRGELILYWHATGSAPVEAAYSFGDTHADILARGGVIAAPYADPTAGNFEWFIVNQSPKQDDFVLADEIVGCLAERIDASHVHSIGMSAGGLQTTAVSFLRANYLASAATFSGGLPAGVTLPSADPANKFAALIFDGGTEDVVFGVDFKAASENYQATLDAAGHFTARCDHGLGHDIPLDAAPSIALFFTAHGFGVSPSPYEGGLPASFPAYCL